MPVTRKINLQPGQDAARKLLLTVVNVADFGATYSTTPKWQLVGVKVADSSIAFNAIAERMTDITGVTHSTVTGVEMTQDLTPLTIRGDSDLALKLLGIHFDGDYTAYSQFEVMVVHAYLTDTSGVKYTAELHSNCNIVPLSIGGSGTVDMPITISFSNNKKMGTVPILKVSDSTFKFTEDSI